MSDNEFESLKSQHTKRSAIASIFEMLWAYKKWWMIPIVVVLLLMTLLIFLSGTAAAPFIYTLF
jgi:hypothetical protein